MANVDKMLWIETYRGKSRSQDVWLKLKLQFQYHFSVGRKKSNIGTIIFQGDIESHYAMEHSHFVPSVLKVYFVDPSTCVQVCAFVSRWEFLQWSSPSVCYPFTILFRSHPLSFLFGFQLWCSPFSFIVNKSILWFFNTCVLYWFSFRIKS